MSGQSIKVIQVKANQTVVDIAIQEYGIAEGMILVLQANPGINVTTALEPGQELNIFSDITINLIKEIVKSEPYASQLQNILMQWFSLISQNSRSGFGPSASVYEDISFEFADITKGTSQTYTLDIKATFGYKIVSAVLETNSGSLNGIFIKINDTNVTGIDSINVTNTASETTATSGNTVTTGARVYICTTTDYEGSPEVLRGKLKIRRT